MFSTRFKRQWLVKLTMTFILVVPGICSATVIARMHTTLGIIDIQLYDTGAPLTVANFLGYARSGAYANSIIHRSVPGFIVQGGGFAWNDTTDQLNYVAANPPVMNEYSADRSNLRGTIAMAKTNLPNSATNQWFFNLADNSANLDFQNGGFTVFGQVLNKGMDVVDAIAALPILPNQNPPFDNLPLSTPITNNTVQKSNLVIVERVSVLASTATAPNRVFAYLESQYPKTLSPANSLSPNSKVWMTGSGYYYRYYAKTKRYVAIAKGTVYWGTTLGSTLKPIGTLKNLLIKASALGY